MLSCLYSVLAFLSVLLPPPPTYPPASAAVPAAQLPRPPCPRPARPTTPTTGARRRPMHSPTAARPASTRSTRLPASAARSAGASPSPSRSRQSTASTCYLLHMLRLPISRMTPPLTLFLLPARQLLDLPAAPRRTLPVGRYLPQGPPPLRARLARPHWLLRLAREVERAQAAVQGQLQAVPLTAHGRGQQHGASSYIVFDRFFPSPGRFRSRSCVLLGHANH